LQEGRLCNTGSSYYVIRGGDGGMAFKRLGRGIEKKKEKKELMEGGCYPFLGGAGGGTIKALLGRKKTNRRRGTFSSRVEKTFE